MSDVPLPPTIFSTLLTVPVIAVAPSTFVEVAETRLTVTGEEKLE